MRVENEQDLKRDLYKSETCSTEIPELELELETGTLGGVYTTIEGFLEKIEDNLVEHNPFVGDSVDPSLRLIWISFLKRFRKCKVEKCHLRLFLETW